MERAKYIRFPYHLQSLRSRWFGGDNSLFDGPPPFALPMSPNSFSPAPFYKFLDGLVKNSVARLHQASDSAGYPQRDYSSSTKYQPTHVTRRALGAAITNCAARE